MKFKNFVINALIGTILGLFVSLIATPFHAYWITCPRLPPPCLEGFGIVMEFFFSIPMGMMLGMIFGIISAWFNFKFKGKILFLLIPLSTIIYFFLIDVFIDLIYSLPKGWF